METRERTALPEATDIVRRDVLLIMPALNEEKCIAQVVRRARRVLPQADVLVIDDGSTDGTRREAIAAGAFVLSHPFNLGIGGAVQTGIKFARGLGYHYVMRIDSDGQHDPQELADMLAVVQRGQADVAVGSRFLADEIHMHIPLMRRLGIEVFAHEVSWLTGRRVTDTTSGMLAMNRRAIELLATHMPQDYPEVESRVILHGAGLVTQEVPVHMGERLAGVSSINSWRSLYYAVKVSLAVLLTALKQPPKSPKLPMESEHAVSPGAYSYGPQPVALDHHHSASSHAQTT
jgi:glycosyltransferase involved in cell wall biosynthesis